MDFDEKIISAEFYRKEHYRGLNALDEIGRKVCTMKTPTVSGFYGKWPKLVELHKKLFNEGFDGAHGALNDAEACAKCFFRLKERGMIPQR
jgi:DNA polymerase III epsilon subunit-like protein